MNVGNREQLLNEQINDKINIAIEKIKNNIKSLYSFKNDLQPQESKEFREILRSIWLNFFYPDTSDANNLNFKLFVPSIVDFFISVNGFDALYQILNQLFHDVFGQDYTKEVNDNLYDSIQFIMDIILNYSDGSSDFGKEFCKHDKILNLYHKMLKEFKENFLKKSISKSITSILKDCIITLYNTLIYDVSENLIKIKAMNYLDTIKEFLKCNDHKIKIDSLLFTAYVADENESKLFKSDPNSILYLIGLLKKSMNSRHKRSHGFSTDELSKGLEKLSKNDENKRLLVELGILPVIKILLEQIDVKYKISALSILWSLAFDCQNRILINNEFWSIISKMKSELKTSHDKDNNKNSKTASGDNKDENAKTNSKDNYMKVLHGLIWTLTECDEKKVLEDMKKTKNQKSAEEKHIMISYNWSNSEIVMKICDTLIDKGYKIWIDRYNITDHENVMESMAQAVQNSCAVLICVSLSYKYSENCRNEALYAKAQKKPIIPVMVQKKYRPDGWLGICICDLHYCDFLGRYKFDEALELLIKRLNKINIGKETKVSLVNF